MHTLTPQAGKNKFPAKYLEMSADALHEELERIGSLADEISNYADAEKRELTAQESTEILALNAEFKDVQKAIEGTALLPRSAKPMPINRRNFGKADKITQRAARDPKDKSWNGLFTNSGNYDQGWKSGDEFLQTLAANQSNDKLLNASMTEGTGEDGGFIVPDFLVSGLMDGALESEIIRPRARVYPMQSNLMAIAGIDSQDHTNSIGGLTGTWMAEGEAGTPQKANFRKIAMRAKKLAIFARASNELVEDGLSFEEQLSSAMQQAISFDLDSAFINGNGAGKPLGILNADSTVTIAKESGQAADTIVFENIVNMWSRLHPGLVNDAVWIANPTVVPQLFQMSFEGSSSSVPAFMPANTGVTGPQPPTMMGRPVLFSEKAPVLGDAGDIILVALSQYAIGLRREVTMQRSIHEGWLTDESDWRLIIRVDGMPLWSSAVTPRNGDSLSWCVTLAERA